MNKKQKKELKIFDKIILYSVILIGLMLFLGLLIHNANSDYHNFRENKNYFKINSEYSVQDWMTPQTVLRHFPISEADLFNALSVTKTELNYRTPIKELCYKTKKDCSKVIEEINSLIKQ
jgi:hypothetical protein